MRKKTDAGFTLIELVVTIVCCSIVTLAVMTVLLTGTRIGRAAEENSGEQQTVRIVLSALENMISDGAVSGIQAAGDDWLLLGATQEGEDTAPVLLSYSGAQGALLTSGGTPLLEGLTSATAELNADKNLLTVTVEVDGEKYPTTVYCRLGASKNGDDLNSKEKVEGKVDGLTADPQTEDAIKATYPARQKFLSMLASQYGSDGDILNKYGVSTGVSYSKWYNSSWGKDAAWCATFLSWGADMTSRLTDDNNNPYLDADTLPRFAHVDKGVAAFRNSSCGTWKTSSPIPGDFIFFDWERDGDPDHVGAVLSVDAKGNIYTIEGNSGGKVAVRYYLAKDARIMGYGVLNWKTDPTA